jgi:hypothetical protein
VDIEIHMKWIYKRLSALLNSCLLACSCKETTQIGSEISLARDSFIVEDVPLAEMTACLGKGQ